MLEQFDHAPYTQEALKYAFHVTKGHKVASKEIIQACQRFIDDLSSGFDFVYEASLGERACRFIEKLPHTKGKLNRGQLGVNE